MTNDEFFKSLSEAEWDDAEAIGQMAHILCSGLTDENEQLFVRAAIERRRADANPSSAPGVELLNAGLAAIGKPLLDYKRKKARGKLSGAGI